MFSIRSLGVVVAAGLLVGCQQMHGTPSASVNTSSSGQTVQGVRASFQAANPNSRVGVVNAVLPNRHLVSVADLPLNEIQEGDVLSILNEQGRDLVEGEVIKKTDKWVQVRYMDLPSGARDPRPGDLAAWIPGGPKVANVESQRGNAINPGAPVTQEANPPTGAEPQPTGTSPQPTGTEPPTGAQPPATEPAAQPTDTTGNPPAPAGNPPEPPATQPAGGGDTTGAPAGSDTTTTTTVPPATQPADQTAAPPAADQNAAPPSTEPAAAAPETQPAAPETQPAAPETQPAGAGTGTGPETQPAAGTGTDAGQTTGTQEKPDLNK